MEIYFDAENSGNSACHVKSCVSQLSLYGNLKKLYYWLKEYDCFLVEHAGYLENGYYLVFYSDISEEEEQNIVSIPWVFVGLQNGR